MIGRKKFISYCVIPAISILTLLSWQTNQWAAQTVSSPVNPDRIASNYPIPYGPATIESMKVFDGD
jgi:hypothetical protein